jgi:iron complex outermembrane receptor protein
MGQPTAPQREEEIRGKEEIPVVEAKPVVVAAARESYSVQNAVSATKTDTPIMETPLNIQVIPQQVLQDKQATTLDQALTNVAGVLSNSFGQGQEQLYLRGFNDNTTFINGFRIVDNSTGLSTLTNVDKIEVLKGPAAILYGAIEPGGLVNIATKQPQATPAYSIEQRFGSWNHYWTNLNATGRLTANDTLLYQFNMSNEDSNSFINGVYYKKLFVAPTIQLNISPATKVTLEGRYTHNPFIFDNVQALPLVNGHLIRVPLSTNLGDTNPYTVDTYFGQFRLTHQFNDQWKINYQAGINNSSAVGTVPTLQLVVPSGNTFIATNGLNYTAPGSGVDSKGTTLNVIGKFDTAGIKHTLLMGGDYYRHGLINNGTSSNVTYSVDMFSGSSGSPTAINPADPGYGTANFTTITKDLGLYVQEQLEFPHHVFATIGVREDRITITNSQNFNFPPFFVLSQAAPELSANALTPRMGLLWRAQNWLSLYGNYTSNLSPNIATDYLGNPLRPSHARQYEGGIKLEAPDGKLRATLAYFDLTKTNVPTTDPDAAHRLLNPSAQVLIGQLGSKGEELDIQGDILPNWKVIANVTHIKTVVLKSEDTTCDITGAFCTGLRFPNIPTWIGNLWTTYEFTQSSLQGWKIGGGVVAQNSSVNANNTVTFPGFAVVNLMTSYTIDSPLGKVTAQLNLNNILNKYYFTGNFSNGGPPGFQTVNFGAPFNAMGSIRIQF